ncbi:hypothetical protein CC80DRAFT_415162 [Byssothecium circinans]|uniref:BTB domain-containing protein n=1 Tax=Byssothecium circinans TaxID=147558 RepID=A0A6A5TU15_9PLEO|nr:hypothetical protein CC80DRAFT_415162 [Byssothecium circinans]
MAIVEVGPERKKFHIHKALLTHHSEYFRKALSGPWIEAQESVVKLSDVDPEAFGTFASWLYTGKYSFGDVEWEDDMERLGASVGIYLPCVKAYELGDRLLADEYRRTANNALAKQLVDELLFGREDFYKLVIYAFEHIAEDRIVLQFLVDYFCKFPNYEILGESPMGTEEIALRQELPRAYMLRVIHEKCDPRLLGFCNGERDERERCYLEHAGEKEQAKCPKLHMDFDEREGLAHFK